MIAGSVRESCAVEWGGGCSRGGTSSLVIPCCTRTKRSERRRRGEGLPRRSSQAVGNLLGVERKVVDPKWRLPSFP